jgi:lipoprotein-releasing system permease protein
MGLRVHFTEPLELYFPSRNRPFSMVNPASSLNNEKLFPAGIFSLEQGFDKKYIFIPISVARELLEYENEVTALELSLKNKDEIPRFKKELRKTLSEDFHVRDRYEQNETLYKMMKSEKLSIYIILLFVLVIISCNLFGSLSMLIIEKREDTSTFKAMGAQDSVIKRIFLIEGWLNLLKFPTSGQFKTY